MKKLKIGIDQGRQDALEAAAYEYTVALNKIVKEYARVQGVRPLQNEDISRICTGESFLKDVLLEVAGEMKIGNLKLSNDKARELVELRGHSGFLEAIQEFQEIWPKHRPVQISLNDFELVNSEVRFKNLEKAVDERCSVYIERPETIKLFELLNGICETLNKKGFNEQVLSLLFNMDRRFIIQREGEFVVNLDLVRRY